METKKTKTAKKPIMFRVKWNARENGSIVNHCIVVERRGGKYYSGDEIVEIPTTATFEEVTL